MIWPWIAGNAAAWLVAAAGVSGYLGRRLRAAQLARPPAALVERVMAEILHQVTHPRGAAPTCATCRALAGQLAAAIADEALERRAVADVPRETSATVTALPTRSPAAPARTPATPIG